MDDEVDATSVAAVDDRPRGVSKARLTDINLGPKISIFYRTGPNAALIPLESSFPKEVAKIFCDRIRDDIEESNAHAFVVAGADQAAYKKIFAWIMDCVQSQSIEKFPDLPEPEDDPFTATFNVILAGDRLGVPAGSLSYHLEKRLNNCARKNLMPLSQVREFYSIDTEVYKVDLKAIACTSIFNAWWDGRLDEDVNPELMEELADMRHEDPKLDEDLHAACKKREEDVRKKWAEKRAKKIAEEAVSSGEWNNSGETNNDTTADGGEDTMFAANGPNDWETPNQDFNDTATSTAVDWGNENAKLDGNNGFNVEHVPDKVADHDFAHKETDATAGGDWADEMNEPVPEPIHTVPMMPW